MTTSSLFRFFSLALAASSLMACAADASEGDERAPSPPSCEGHCEATVERAVLPVSPAPELRLEALAAYQQHQRADARTTHGPIGANPAAEEAIGDRSACAGGVERVCDVRGTCWCPTTPLATP